MGSDAQWLDPRPSHGWKWLVEDSYLSPRSLVANAFIMLLHVMDLPFPIKNKNCPVPEHFSTDFTIHAPKWSNMLVASFTLRAAEAGSADVSAEEEAC